MVDEVITEGGCFTSEGFIHQHFDWSQKNEINEKSINEKKYQNKTARYSLNMFALLFHLYTVELLSQH